MRRHAVTRIFALWLSVSLALPPSAWALRAQMDKAGLEDALRPTAGLEEPTQSGVGIATAASLTPERLIRLFGENNARIIYDEIQKTVGALIPDHSKREKKITELVEITWPKTHWNSIRFFSKTNPGQATFLGIAAASQLSLFGWIAMKALLGGEVDYVNAVAYFVGIGAADLIISDRFTSGLGAYIGPPAVAILISNKISDEALLRRMVSHEVAHDILPGPNHVQDTVAQVRLMQEGLLEKMPQRNDSLVFGKGIPVSELQDYLEKKTKMDLPFYERSSSGSEPFWTYKYARDLGQEIFFLADESFKKTFRIISRIGKGNSLVEALRKADATAGMEEVESGRRGIWKENEAKVLAVIQRAARSRNPKFSLAPGKIQSKEQRATPLGKELYHAYKAVVNNKAISTLLDWPTALERAGEDSEAIYAEGKKVQAEAVSQASSIWVENEEKVLQVIQRAARSRNPKFSLATGKIRSKEQRATPLGKELYNAYAAVVDKKAISTLPDWLTALERAGEDPEAIYAEGKSARARAAASQASSIWVENEEKVLQVIQRAARSRNPKFSLAPGKIKSKEQRATPLGKELYHAYHAVVGSKAISTLPDWPTALEEAGEDPEAIYQRQPRRSAAGMEEVESGRSGTWKENEAKVLAVIQRAARSRNPKFALAPGKIKSNEQRATPLGKELYHAYEAVVTSKAISTLPDWPTALERAGKDPQAIYQRRPGRSTAGLEEVESSRRGTWQENEAKVLAVIQRAARSRNPKFSLAPGKIRSKEQRATPLGKELYHAYSAVVTEKTVSTLPDWPTALERAGEDPEAIYAEGKRVQAEALSQANSIWVENEEKVLEVIQRVARSRNPKFSLAPGKIKSKEQRATPLGKELFHAYEAVVASKAVSTLPDWPTALERAGEDPEAIYAEGRKARAEAVSQASSIWVENEEKVLEVIQRAARSRNPKFSLAPGRIESKEQRATPLGKELFHAYEAIVASKAISTLPDWWTALERAGENPEAIYQRQPRRSTAGMEEVKSGRRGTWKENEAKVLAVIERAARSHNPKFSLTSGKIRSKEQRATPLGKELYNAYHAVVTSRAISTLPDWPTALERAGEDSEAIYAEGKKAQAEAAKAKSIWGENEGKVLQVIQRAARSRNPKFSLAPRRVRSKEQRATPLGKELYHAYSAVVPQKAISTLLDWPTALERAGEDSEAIYAEGKKAQAEAAKAKSIWVENEEKVLEVIQRAARSRNPKFSLAPGKIQSKAQQATPLGKELFHAYEAVVASKAVSTLPDWWTALERAGEDSEAIYQRQPSRSTAGLEEGAVIAESTRRLSEEISVSRVTRNQFVDRFGQASRLPENTRGAWLMPANEGMTDVHVHIVHETLLFSVTQFIQDEIDTLPEGFEIHTHLLKPDQVVPLETPGVALKDRLLELPEFWRGILSKIVPVLEHQLGQKLPSLAEIVLYAIHGADGRMEKILGVMRLEDSRGRAVYAFFV